MSHPLRWPTLSSYLWDGLEGPHQGGFQRQFQDRVQSLLYMAAKLGHDHTCAATDTCTRIRPLKQRERLHAAVQT